MRRDGRNGGAGSGATRLSLAVLVAIGAVLVLPAACGAPSNTSEVAGPIGWGTIAEPSEPFSDTADGQPAPQVMAEVTLPDGGVPTVPQPAVPEAPPPSTVPRPADTPPETAPPVLAAPSAASGTLPSIQVPDIVPGGARALERLSSDAQRTVASKALGRIRFDWKSHLSGWQIRFLPGRAGLRGSTFPDEQVIEVYVRDSDRPEGLSHVIAHEMGHAIDVSRLGTLERETWRLARGIPSGVPWFPGVSGATDYSTGAGDWAESFASWQTGSGWYSRLGPPPDVVQTALLAQLAGLA